MFKERVKKHRNLRSIAVAIAIVFAACGESKTEFNKSIDMDAGVDLDASMMSDATTSLDASVLLDVGIGYDAEKNIDADLSDLGFDSDLVDLGQDMDPIGRTIALGERKAFPTAHGYARHTTGGRGGQILEVTNLNADGPGSLREALLKDGPRIIVFRVAGNIDFGRTIQISDDNYSVLGQTAPGDGVAIFSDIGGIESRAGEAIWRHVRFRGSAVISNLRIIARNRTSPLENVIVDHCSFTWPSSAPDSNEMNISFTGDNGRYARSFTVQSSILGEATRGALLYKGSYNATFYQNLWVSTDQRNPRVNYPDDIPDGVQQFETINNIVHATREGVGFAYGGRVRASNNVWTLSTEQGSLYGNGFVRGTSSGEGTPSETYAHVSGNLTPAGQPETGSLPNQYLFPTPFEETDLVGDFLLPAARLDEILPHVGARPDARDSIDARLVQEYRDQLGGRGEYDGTPALLVSGPLPEDANNNDIADDFEATHAITSADDRPEHFIINGVKWDNREYTGGASQRVGYVGGTPTGDRLYTWREIYWHHLAGDFELHHWQ